MRLTKGVAFLIVVHSWERALIDEGFNTLPTVSPAYYRHVVTSTLTLWLETATDKSSLLLYFINKLFQLV